jgi:hypothetical protein
MQGTERERDDHEDDQPGEQGALGCGEAGWLAFHLGMVSTGAHALAWKGYRIERWGVNR